MADPCPDAYYSLALSLADAAGAAIRPHWRTLTTSEQKDDDSPVTEADRAAEAEMRQILGTVVPQHGIVGEEFGVEREDADYVWVLDPIDGTKSFMTGRPIFGTLIALLRRGVPILGIIDQPITGDRWIGATGHTALFNETPAAARHCAALKDAIVATTSPDLFSATELPLWSTLSRQCRIAIYGGDCYNYGLVAAGSLDVVVESGLKLHDFAALVPIVEGAGGRMADWEGRPLNRDSDGRIVAVGDPGRLDEVLRTLHRQ